MLRDLSLFENNKLHADAPRLFLWWIVQNLFFKSFLVPSKIRVILLRTFGAKIGNSVIVRRGVRVHFPHNLVVGNNVWIGEDVWIINHAVIHIGSNVCISQSAVLCSSGHDFLSPSLQYKHAEIKIADGAWICLKATLLSGSHIGCNSVVSAAEVFSGVLPDSYIFRNGINSKIQFQES